MDKAKQHSNAERATCSAPGCEAHATRVGAVLCEKHYMRRRRNGTYDRRARAKEMPHSHGYVLEWAKGHPLDGRVDTMTRVYQHRRVFHDHHGEGPFECHWCSTPVTWDDMHVDHLNAVKHDNRPDNLVASCPACNKARGVEKMTRTHRERSKAKIEWRGEALTVGEWAKRIGISPQSLKWRIDNGWPMDKAMTQGRGPSGPKSAR